MATSRELFDDLLGRIHDLDKSSALERQKHAQEIAVLKERVGAMETRCTQFRASDKRGSVERAKVVLSSPVVMWLAMAAFAVVSGLLGRYGINVETPAAPAAIEDHHAEPDAGQ